VPVKIPPKIIHIFGNPLLDFDNLPIKMAPKLKKVFPKINFIITDPNENLKPDANGELFIIDTVDGLTNVKVFDSLKEFQSDKLYSMHDFDLGFNLKLFEKLGMLKKVKIIGVPMKNISEKYIFLKLKAIINLCVLTKE
jgi:Ni,Fe-hydrogenase maturation factor